MQHNHAELAAKIALLAQEKGWNQEDFANIAGLNRQTIRQILRHPMYAGAYRYGFRPTDPRRQTAGRPRSGRGGGLAAEDCLVFLRDRFPAYITWERFEANQARLAANRSW